MVVAVIVATGAAFFFATVAIVVATHDPAVVDACDLHIALDEGRVVQ